MIPRSKFAQVGIGVMAISIPFILGWIILPDIKNALLNDSESGKTYSIGSYSDDTDESTSNSHYNAIYIYSLVSNKI